MLLDHMYIYVNVITVGLRLRPVHMYYKSTLNCAPLVMEKICMRHTVEYKHTYI